MHTFQKIKLNEFSSKLYKIYISILVSIFSYEDIIWENRLNFLNYLGPVFIVFNMTFLFYLYIYKYIYIKTTQVKYIVNFSRNSFTTCSWEGVVQTQKWL